MSDFILENNAFRLVLGQDAIVKSLILKETGEECLDVTQCMPLFSVTQDRPYNNEVKLAHPNKRTTWQANAVRREGNTLVVSFDIVPVKARIETRLKGDYIAFRLAGFDVDEGDYPGLKMTPPPVSALRLVQLPLKKRTRFGEWLNVVWDDAVAVCVMAASPAERIDQDERGGSRVLYAEASRDLRLVGAEAVLIVSKPEGFLNAVDHMENDFGLPRGAQARRGSLMNASVYWTAHIDATDVDRHIARCLQGGFRLMLIYYTAFFHEEGGYSYCGDYDYNAAYPNGPEDVQRLLDRIKQAGITPGLHFLQTHIGLKSRYVTPRADDRLGHKRMFTLARDFHENDTELYVRQDPTGSEMCAGCRVLQFGGELMTYEGYTAEPPYRFTGVARGANGTVTESHPQGQIGGILDISEYGATSCYIDQDTDLQDEVADKIAACYNAGFQFCYMDGSEGTNPPHECHVPLAQYRVLKKFDASPLFTEGAAKAHFSWHFQAGANAFDIFPPSIFKAMIAKFPAAEAPLMRQDFTRLDFGWWGFWAPDDRDNGIQADMYEYGTSRAAGWDCPATVQASLSRFDLHPRIDDILEVMRRWEDVRAKNWLTDGQKAQLRDLKREHTLLIDEKGDYELVPCERIAAPEDISAFFLTRHGENWVVYWHERGECDLGLDVRAEDITVMDRIGGKAIRPKLENGLAVIPAAHKRYIRTSLSRAAIERVFAQARLL